MATSTDPGTLANEAVDVYPEAPRSSTAPLSTANGGSMSFATGTDLTANTSSEDVPNLPPNLLEENRAVTTECEPKDQHVYRRGEPSEILEGESLADTPLDNPPPHDNDLSDGQEPATDNDSILMEAEKSFLELYNDLNRKMYTSEDMTPRNVRNIRVAHDSILRREHAMPLRWRTGRAKLLSFAFQAYLRLIDDRLEALETASPGGGAGDYYDALQVPLSGPTNPAVDAGDQQEEWVDVDVPTPTLNRVTWLDYKRNHDSERNIKEEHAIDVLKGDPIIPYNVWRNRSLREAPIHIRQIGRSWNLRDLQEPAPEKTQGDNIPAETKPIQHPAPSYSSMPDRIRLNGNALIQLLDRALELGIETTDKPIVFLKPFKVLLHYEVAIRKLHRLLRKKFVDSAEVVTDTETSSKSAESTTAARDQEGQGDGGREDSFTSESGQNLLETCGTEQAYKELCCLIEFMDHDLKIVTEFEKGLARRIYFSDLWHIFHPGEEVITSTSPVNAYRVLHVTGGRPYLSPPEERDEESNDFTKPYRIPEKWGDFVVTCYQIDFDGNKFGPVTREFRIQKYVDQRDITSLQIYPLKFANDSVRVREKLQSNGHTFLRLCRGRHVQYRGPNLHEVENLDSQIIVDFNAALSDQQDKDHGWQYTVDFGIHPPSSADSAEVVMVSRGGCREQGCCENDHVYNDINLDYRRMEGFIQDKKVLTTDVRYLSDDPDQIDEKDMILFPHQLFAFVLKDRKWAVVDINNVKMIDDKAQQGYKGWESLILPKGHKSMVYSLVQAHFRARRQGGLEEEAPVDLIRGKGRGLIILLHGAPGVGKTSTAECVAELCDRPLYPITCGDLGITAQEVENHLKRIFVQAQKWKCVLLLDEADVFLSQRENNVKHNSLVSVFLRVLEYYQGILFLTTNRVGKMDEAFRSRVHISLYYPPLSKESTLDIFRENIKLIERRKVNQIRVKKEEIEAFAEDHYDHNPPRTRWNGRQIRNAFHIAVALAENEAIENMDSKKNSNKKVREPVLRPRHFGLVEEASTNFDDYLTSVLGMAQSELAKQKSVRLDGWRANEGRNLDTRGYDSRRSANTYRRGQARRAVARDSSSYDTDQSHTDGEGSNKRIDSSDPSDLESERRRRRDDDDQDDEEDSGDLLTIKEKRKGKQKTSEGRRDRQEKYKDEEHGYAKRSSKKHTPRDSSRTRR